MHTFDWKGKGDTERELDVETTVTIHHNGDFSGCVEINVPSDVARCSTAHYTNNGVDYHIASMHVPFEALRDFVVDAIWRKKISDLANLTPTEIIDLWRA